MLTQQKKPVVQKQLGENIARPTTPKRNLLVGDAARMANPAMNKTGSSWLASPYHGQDKRQAIGNIPSFEETWNPVLSRPSTVALPIVGRPIVGSAFSSVVTLEPVGTVLGVALTNTVESMGTPVISTRKRVRFSSPESGVKRRKIEGVNETPSKIVHNLSVGKTRPPTPYARERSIPTSQKRHYEDDYEQAPKSIPGMALRIMNLLDGFTDPFHKFEAPPSLPEPKTSDVCNSFSKHTQYPDLGNAHAWTPIVSFQDG